MELAPCKERVPRRDVDGSRHEQQSENGQRQVDRPRDPTWNRRPIAPSPRPDRVTGRSDIEIDMTPDRPDDHEEQDACERGQDDPLG